MCIGGKSNNKGIKSTENSYEISKHRLYWRSVVSSGISYWAGRWPANVHLTYLKLCCLIWKPKGDITWTLCFRCALKFYEVTIFIAWWMSIWLLLIKVLWEIPLNIFISLINALNILRYIEKDSQSVRI